VDAAASSSSRLSAIACLALCQPRGGSPTSRPRSRLMSGMWDEICWEMSEPLAFVPESPSTLKVKAFPHQYSKRHHTTVPTQAAKCCHGLANWRNLYSPPDCVG
jgi:hypothetical protein